MKLLFDHNLAQRLVPMLKDLYPGSQHVRQLGLADADDDAIWNYARKQEMTIVSKDSDFYYRSMLSGHPPKIVWIKLGNCKTVQVATLLKERHADLVEFNQVSSASFLILP